MLLGCIADDFTGATDLANMLVRAGMRTVQTIGIPGARTVDGDPDAVVVALKSRTVPAAEAVAQSLAALAWLRAGGARQIYFKYCSTFDSTDAGNIGPVANARASREREPGCRQFDVCTAPDDRATVFLYEVYDDRAAFDAHLASAHFKSFDATVGPWVERKTGRTYTRAALS